MLKRLRFFVLSILCVQMVSTGVFADEREPATIAVTKPKGFKPIELSFENSNALRNVLFDNIRIKTELAKSLEGFRAMYLKHLSREDQNAFLILMSQANELPKFKRVNDRLIAQLGSEKIVVQWPNPLRSEIVVNGMKVVLKVNRPLFEQVVVLAERLKYRKSAGLLDLAISEAQAVPVTYGAYKITYNAAETVAEAAKRTGLFKRLWAGAKGAKWAVVLGGIVAAVGSEFVTTVKATSTSAIRNKYCEWTESISMISSLGLCEGWEKERAEKIWKDLRLDSLLTIENASKNGKLIDSDEKACPTKNDKKDRVLLTLIRPVEWKDGKMRPIREDFSMLRATFDPVGNPKSLMVAPLGVDMEKALETEDGRNQIWLSVTFGKENGQVTGMQIANPDYKAAKVQRSEQISSDAGALATAAQKIIYDSEPATLPLDPAMKLTPAQKERLMNATQIVDWVRGKLFQCVLGQAIKQIDKGIDPTKPVPVKADTETSNSQSNKTAQ